uniref:Protein kinase domain-containing protein n=1 Tax=Compsopogon caeruleus TaxID=31354 RepID=A0A7S1TAE0_9RHOD
MDVKKEQLTEFLDSINCGGRYRLKRVVGKGSYGVVCEAEDVRNGNQKVAIKRLNDAVSSRSIALRNLRELKILRHFRNVPNLISIQEVLIPANSEFNDVYVVMDFMPTDLYRLLRRDPLSPKHIKFFLFQILRGLAHLHAARIFHRDLKPDNILVNSNCEVKICDFGMARSTFERQDYPLFTRYVAMLWYRAPELILCRKENYSTAVDLWSVGCIFCEMLDGGRPFFRGSDDMDQMALMARYLGRPPDSVISQIQNPELRQFVDAFQLEPREPMHTVFPQLSDSGLDLLLRLLDYDPSNRITAAEAIHHPFFKSYKMLITEQDIPILPAEEFLFEERVRTAQEYRREFVEEIRHYHPDADLSICIGRETHQSPFGGSQHQELPNAMSIDVGDQRLARSAVNLGRARPPTNKWQMSVPRPNTGTS